MNPIQFKPLHENDLILLHQWFQEPLINQHYARNKVWSFEEISAKYLPRIQSQEKIPSFIVSINNKPIGYIQYYCLTNYLPEGISTYNNSLFKDYYPDEIAGIDLFIAVASERGKNLGKTIITNFIIEFLINYKVIVVDPEATNISAIRCYEKTDFIKSNVSENENHLIMIKKLPYTIKN
jgi:aminoglycoside 6'-N-acetyltransferase